MEMHSWDWNTNICIAAAKSLQSCLTWWNPTDDSPPGSPVPGIPQARTLEWVAISFSNAWKWKVKVKSLSCVRPSETPWTAAYQAPPSMGFSRQEYWSGVPSPALDSLREAVLAFKFNDLMSPCFFPIWFEYPEFDIFKVISLLLMGRNLLSCLLCLSLLF